MEAELAKIHVPLLYTRIWQLVAVDLSPSLSIQNFPPFYGGGKFKRLIVDGLSRHGALVHAYFLLVLLGRLPVGGHLLLSISKCTCARWLGQLTKGKILRLSSRMEASRRSGHGQLVAVGYGENQRRTINLFWACACMSGARYLSVLWLRFYGRMCIALKNTAFFGAVFWVLGSVSGLKGEG